MKKVIGLTLLSTLSLILIIIGITNRNSTTTEAAPAAYSFLILTWLLSITITIPALKLKNKSTFLTVILWMQIFVIPLNVILGSIYIYLDVVKKQFVQDSNLEPIVKGGTK